MCKKALVLVLLLATIVSGGTLEQARNASVTIKIGERGHGSGVHIGNGVILTAAHCIGDNMTVVDVNEVEHQILFRWWDSEQDVGFLIIEGADMPSIEFGTMSNVGDEIYCIGTPVSQIMFNTVTRGMMAREDVEIPDLWDDVFVIDCAIFPGNSGCAVLNADFELVGIVVGGFAWYDGLGFCESINDILESRNKCLEYLLETFMLLGVVEND